MGSRWLNWALLLVLYVGGGGGCGGKARGQGSSSDNPLHLGKGGSKRGSYPSTSAAPLPAPPPTLPAAVPHVSAGADLLRRGEYDQSIAELKRALQVDPNSVEAHDHLGIAYFKKGNYAAAIKEFQAEIRLEVVLKVPIGGLPAALSSDESWR